MCLYHISLALANYSMFQRVVSIIHHTPGRHCPQAFSPFFHTFSIQTACGSTSRNTGNIQISSSSGKENRHELSLPSERRKVIFVLGVPGAGKRTLCNQLSKHLDYEHLSVRDLIRRERDTFSSEYGRIIAHALQHPRRLGLAETTVALLRRAMVNSAKSGFLVHDFPVNLDGLNAWEAEMQPDVKILCVLLLEVNPQVSVERCFGKIRQDDTRTVLKKRMDYCIRELSPVVEYYERKRRLKQIDGNRSSEFSFARAKMILAREDSCSGSSRRMRNVYDNLLLNFLV